MDHRTDLFSLGVMLYEMASGRRPFRSHSSAQLVSSILWDTPPSLTELKGDIPEALARIIEQCLEKDPDRRFQKAHDLYDALTILREEIASGASGHPLPAGRPTVPGPAQRPVFLPRAPSSWVQGHWKGVAAIVALVIFAAMRLPLDQLHDGDFAAQLGIAGSINFTHPACTERCQDFVGPKSTARVEGPCFPSPAPQYRVAER